MPHAEQQSYPCGQVATNALIDKIGISPPTCVGDTRDRYTRLLATCFVDDLDGNGWLVQHEYALAYRKYSTRYVDEEEEAKALKRGVWSGTFTPPWDHRRGAREDVSCGVAAPHDAVPGVSAKGLKIGGARARPVGCLCPGPVC